VDAAARIDDDGGVGLRVVVISFVAPIGAGLVGVLRDLGHEPVAIMGARRSPERPPPPEDQAWLALTDANAPPGVDVLLPKDKWALEPLLRANEPDVALSYGYPWKIPPEALSVPRYGSANHHPAKLPRHRGPIPFAWALREGDPEFGITWHRMDAELDTGNILARSAVPLLDTDTTIMDFAPRVAEEAFRLVPVVLEKLVAGDPGEPQDDSLASWAGPFEEEYAAVDLTRTAREVHNQVRAWNLTFGMYDGEAPVLELDGERLRLVRTSLTEPGNGEARRIECGDGPLWIVESEPGPAGEASKTT
jgi:methionyl-tRNA formyltransferase